MAVERLLLTDGTSRLLLVDGSSMLLLTTSTAGGDVTVSIPAIDIAIAAQAPSVTAGSTVGASVDVPSVDVAVAAQAPTIAAGKTIAVPAVDITISAQAPSVQAGEVTTEQFTGGWLSLPDYTRGREEYIRLQRIAMGITPEQPESAIVIPEAVLQSAKVVAMRQRGVRMERREAELRAEVERTQAWKDDYAGVLYAELYRIEKQRREDDLIVALLAA